MSDTPRTDKATCYITDIFGAQSETTNPAIARQLERELAEAKAYADKLADGLPVGMLPKDVENLREANAGLAAELSAVTADLEFRRELGALQQQEYDKVTAERDVLKAELAEKARMPLVA